ncbi:HD domain-containing protein [Vibrio xiamenensis]|uniref:HD domain-containing protein n=1 Tax=Vibrio xiamenensis TaxID=861298 RepID=A0A1G7YHT7_9VIBR|nr:HD-GYP domain-containing protein [Vibrio xiamenensis]SDG96128.1 HD domain-containing protein [Vibrio xiamenensis]
MHYQTPPTVKIPLAELMLSLTTALDMTEGQPPEHCIRGCWIGMAIGKALELNEADLNDLYFTLLLKDAGCSSNAARICELYLSDDRSFKRNFKTVGTSLSSVLNFVIHNTAVGRNWVERITTTIDVLKNGQTYANELIETRCTRGAEIAKQLRFSDEVAEGVQSLDEHWDGSGRPMQKRGVEIPLYSRIALIAQVVDVFQIEHNLEAAVEEIKSRRGTWFDPFLVDTLCSVVQDPEFIAGLNSLNIVERVMTLAPAQAQVLVDDDYFDCIVTAFGQIIDSKSPYTGGHSERVAVYSTLIANELGLDETETLWIKRAALLHDLGKLGVSNRILDKPDKLSEKEWLEVKRHAELTEQILSKITPLHEFARLAASHHEKLDGSGYPNQLTEEHIPLFTRIITTADIFDAITAERPYRGAIPVDKTLSIMQKNIGTAIDERCFKALKTALDKLPSQYQFVAHASEADLQIAAK